MRPRFSREAAPALAGATAAELAAFERDGLLVPNAGRWPPWGRREPYYTQQQVEVLKWLVLGRRRRPDQAGRARQLPSSGDVAADGCQ